MIKGKRIFLDLDASGQAEFVRMWTDRLEAWAAGKGALICGVNFSNIRFALNRPVIPKKKFVPKKATIKARGWLSASLNGRDITRRFAFRNKTIFLNKQ
ncbi:MAG: hypothetical protein ACU841_14795 [Gammaproteobacteria bacterium]